jgi:hypothetical protein
MSQGKNVPTTKGSNEDGIVNTLPLGYYCCPGNIQLAKYGWHGREHGHIIIDALVR